MPPLTWAEVADFFIASAAADDGIPLRRLHTLLYYAQASHLALRGCRLFTGTFVAGPRGPILPALQRRYAFAGFTPIARPDLTPA